MAFAVTLGVAVFAGAQIVNAIEQRAFTATYSMRVGDLTRSWMIIGPTAPLPADAPVLLVLSGKATTTSNEVSRDFIINYAEGDEAEVVYPEPVHESWNAIGCCGTAAELNINDVAFIKALVPKIDPGNRRPIYVIGYSNGGRLAYRLACTDPGLFNAIAIVKADPMPGCPVEEPQTIIQIAAVGDPWVPYKQGEKGFESPSATVQIKRLHAALGCPAKSSSARYGIMTLTTWSPCADGTRLGFAVWPSGGHDFPVPLPHTPGASQVVWSFLTHTPLAPLPG